MAVKKHKRVVILASLFLLPCLWPQGISQQNLDALEDKINTILRENGHDYIRIIITTDESGTVKIHSYFLRELGNMEYPSKMTMVATLVGNSTQSRDWSASRLIFFETHKEIFGWVLIRECWDAVKVENFKDRIDFVMSKLKRDKNLFFHSPSLEF
jgi:hypothetical protein